MNKLLTALSISAAVAFAAPALAKPNCAIDFQHAYEKGVEDGRGDAGAGLDRDAKRHRPHLKRNSDRGSCYVEGYRNGYANVAADLKKKGGRMDHSNAPKKGTNERAYYDDGCREGASDARANMSRNHERHADMYDGRFEPAFKQGYYACFDHNR